MSTDLGGRELCHDLRQPLASAVVLTHMLDKELGLTDAGRQRLDMLHGELGRLAGMLSAQLEPADPVLVDLAEVVQGVCRGLVQAAASPVEVLVEQTPLVLGDPVQLSRLVSNLVANARSAAGPDGTVRVQVGASQSAACVAVEDSGGAGPASGFGLGLMIVDSVVRRHRGTSACTASELGGLRVAVTIPGALPVQHPGGRA